jgi:hypothetical protein
MLREEAVCAMSSGSERLTSQLSMEHRTSLAGNSRFRLIVVVDFVYLGPSKLFLECYKCYTVSEPITAAARSKACLRSLEHWDPGFESHSRHGCLCLCCSVYR